jgi:hypothetical protein
MKTSKKQKKNLPEVHILGDLKDVKNLISCLNKKKTIVIFHDAEQDSFYLEIDGKFQQVLQGEFAQLEKEYKLIVFSFFPSRKKAEPETKEKTETQEPEKKAKKEKVAQKEKKAKKKR